MATTIMPARLSLLGLPPELRNKIYDLVLFNCNGGDRVEHWRLLVPHALVQVNKQLRAETLPIYYGTNKFKISLCASTSTARASSRLQDWAESIRDFHDKIEPFANHLKYIPDLTFLIFEEVEDIMGPDGTSLMLDFGWACEETFAIALKRVNGHRFDEMEKDISGQQLCRLLIWVAKHLHSDADHLDIVLSTYEER
ncbi:hypothetical protein F4778DRAFT_781742 [Xylariomycetidae sp. FL2044]|nr:hypothetical protein F4778DRAFT_781742 [Xylariomycetidae sp. FL2044]